MKKFLVIAVIALLVIVAIETAYFTWPMITGQQKQVSSAPQPITGQPQTSTQPVACTQETKICPDGSSVSRTEPNCEFGHCPVVENSSWTTFTDSEQGVSFQYPSKLDLIYVVLPSQGWPPVATITDGSLSCQPSTSSPVSPSRELKSINGHNYCVEAMGEGAAGTIYVNDVYTFQSGSKIVALKFSLGYPQCVNYDEPKQTDCKNQQKAFDLDAIIDQIASTVKFK